LAFLLAWLDWSGRSIPGPVGDALLRRAGSRTHWPGEVRAGRNWCLYAARQRQLEPAVLLEAADEADDGLLALDRALGDEDGADRRRMSWTESRLLDGTACAAVRLQPTRETLELTRDPLGQRPLVYARVAGAILVASGEDVLRAHPALASDLDEEFLAAYLACLSPAPDATVFRAIRSVAPGESLVISREGVQGKRIRLEPDCSWRGQRDEAMVEQFRELLGSSVRRACRGARRVGISLSAGMDSSSVAALAVAMPEPDAKRFVGVCYGFDQRPETDERAMVRRLGQYLDIEVRDVAVDALHPLAAEYRRPLSPDTPVASPFREFKQAAYREFVDAGVDIVLDGHFGDHLVPNPADLIADSAVGLRLKPLARALWRLYRRVGIGGLARSSAWRTLGASLCGRDDHPTMQWLREPWRTRLRDRLAAEVSTFRQFPRPRQAHHTLNAYAGLSGAAEQYYAQQQAIEFRSPFRDLALTRWCLSAPSDLHHRHGMRKWLLREAMRGLLPDEIRLRPKGSSLAPFLAHAQQHRHAELAQLRRLSQAWTQRLCLDPQGQDDALRVWLESYLGLWLDATAKD